MTTLTITNPPAWLNFDAIVTEWEHEQVMSVLDELRRVVKDVIPVAALARAAQDTIAKRLSEGDVPDEVAKAVTAYSGAEDVRMLCLLIAYLFSPFDQAGDVDLLLRSLSHPFPELAAAVGQIDERLTAEAPDA